MKVLYKRQKPSKNTTKVESGLTDFHKMNVIVVKVHYKRKKIKNHPMQKLQNLFKRFISKRPE